MKRAALFAMAIMALAAASATSAAEGNCQLVKVAEWQLRPNHYLPVVDGAINGQGVQVLLDTGAFISAVNAAAASKLALPPAPLTTGYGRIDGIRSFGVEGERRSQGAYIGELRIGDAVRKDWLARVTPLPLSEDIALVLGYEFFHQLDVEFDLPHDAVRLFQPRIVRMPRSRIGLPPRSPYRSSRPVACNSWCPSTVSRSLRSSIREVALLGFRWRPLPRSASPQNRLA